MVLLKQVRYFIHAFFKDCSQSMSSAQLCSANSGNSGGADCAPADREADQ